ncbi:MAG: hypothetical protein KJS91_13590 [Planctomycetes bacterium]|nr:hypothetical protein [Planctomycetota bacterium]
MKMAFVSLAAVIAITLVGCGEGANQGKANAQTNDAAKLASLVTEFADTGTNLTMKNYFSGGKTITPAEHKRYIGFSYQLEGSPAVSGDSAKANVKITPNEGSASATKEWLFALDKGTWKIKDAPLP